VTSDSDPWPHEPDEFDPESQWDDPAETLVDIPDPTLETEIEPQESESLSGDGARRFGLAVIYANGAIAGIGLGLLLIGFDVDFGWGGVVTSIGLFCGYRTYRVTEEHYQEISGPDAEVPSSD